MLVLSRQILQQANVHLPEYKKVMAFEAQLDVGLITKIHEDPSCSCLGFKTDFMDTLQRIVDTPDLFNLFEFWSAEQQSKAIEYLKSRDPDLYRNLNLERRSIVVRVTGTIRMNNSYFLDASFDT